MIITVGSVTYAIKLKRLFSREGIPTRLIKIDATDVGCTHGLEIPEKNFYSAVVIMKKYNVNYSIVAKNNDLS